MFEIALIISGILAILAIITFFLALSNTIKNLRKISNALGEIANAIKERPTATSQAQHFAGQEVKEEPRKVGELPPEIVAPNFTKPPRPAGGFGSRASQRDDGDS